jgi:hypothetical protein
MGPTELKNHATFAINDAGNYPIEQVNYYLLKGLIYALLYIGTVLSEKLDDINKSIKATIK